MDKKQVEKIASLARLKLTEEEKEKFSGQLEDILGYIDQLKELDTKDTEPIGQPLIDKLRLADDNIVDFDNIEALHEIAPDFKDGLYRVRKVIE